MTIESPSGYEPVESCLCGRPLPPGEEMCSEDCPRHVERVMARCLPERLAVGPEVWAAAHGEVLAMSLAAGTASPDEAYVAARAAAHHGRDVLGRSERERVAA